MTKLPYLASAASLWRGYDYYTDHKVLSWEPTESGERPQQFDGVVSGNGLRGAHRYSASEEVDLYLSLCGGSSRHLQAYGRTLLLRLSR